MSGDRTKAPTNPLPLLGTPGERVQLDAELRSMRETAEIDRGTVRALILAVGRLRFAAGVSVGISLFSLAVALVRLWYKLEHGGG